MRLAFALLGCLALAGVARAGDDAAATRASVELQAEKDSYYVGEPIRLRLWIGYDEAYFRDHAVSKFLQPMDVPLKVEAPSFRGWVIESSTANPESRAGDDASKRVRLALNDAIVEATVLGRMDRSDVAAGGGVSTLPSLRMLEVVREFTVIEPGDLLVLAPTLSFSYAATFLDDLINGREPVDPKDAVIEGKPLTLRILPLPEAGRPAEFSGAVGRYAVMARVEERKVRVGEHFRLSLRITGTGALATLPTPRLDRLAGFHVFGAIDDRRPILRTIVYDLAALSADVKEIPPIPFAYFDPGPESPAGYRVARTDRIGLHVQVADGAPTAPRTPAPAPGLVSEPGFQWASGALVVLVLAALTLRARRRARARATLDPSMARKRAAAVAFRERAAHPNADLAAAFADVLAAHLDCPPAAVIAPDLEARLLAHGLESALAARAAATMDRLVHAGYGGGAAETDATMARALVDELTRAAR